MKTVNDISREMDARNLKSNIFDIKPKTQKTKTTDSYLNTVVSRTLGKNRLVIKAKKSFEGLNNPSKWKFNNIFTNDSEVVLQTAIFH